MKRLLEWKQRMLHSPLTRKSTHAGIYLATSSNQKLKGVDQHRNKNYSNASYNTYSSDDEGISLFSFHTHKPIITIKCSVLSLISYLIQML